MAECRVLAKAIRNTEHEIICIAEVRHQGGGSFSQTDEEFFEALVIFCGLGITNCQLYDEVSQAKARVEVSLDVLSYHVSATGQETQQLLRSTKSILNEQESLLTMQYNDFKLPDNQTVQACFEMLNETKLVKKFKIDSQTLARWLLTVQKNYRDVPYHNWCHAFNVFQSMFVFLHTCKLQRYFSDLETLGLLVGCLCHDLDHRGENNNFQSRTSSNLSVIYGNKSTMEQHHFQQTINILSREENNIFRNLDSESYHKMIKLLQRYILATDLSKYFQIRDKFFELASSDVCDWTDASNNTMLQEILMTGSDLASATKSWPVARKAAMLVMEEFFNQGDIEREHYNWQPQAMMDRRKENEVPKLQIGWIESVCVPLYSNLARIDPGLELLHDGVQANRKHWLKEEELREKSRN